MRISQHPAYILHYKAYRETSMLLDVFTQDYGCISLVARGVRQSKSQWRALLQPFVPLLISWQGKSELMTLSTAEARGLPITLTGERLMSGFYLNELLTRLLHKHDPHPQLYTIYHHTLLELQGLGPLQKILRLFEKKLLLELGYGLYLENINADLNYWFHPELGFTLCETEGMYAKATVFSGRHLLMLKNEDLQDVDALREMKRLMRMALAPLLGAQPLHSKKLFIGVTE